MALGIVLIAIGALMVGLSGVHGRWTAGLEERNTFLRPPITGSPLIRLRTISTAIAGLLFIAVGVAAWAAS